MTANIEQTNLFINMLNATPQTVLAIDSGKTHLLPAQGIATQITLPLPKPGLNYKFFVNAATAGFNITITATGGATVSGSVMNVTQGNGAASSILFVTRNGGPNIIIRAQAARGTYLNMNCTGNVWYIDGMSPTVGFQ